MTWSCQLRRLYGAMINQCHCHVINVPQNVPQNGAAFYTRQEYAKDGTKTLVASGRPLSDYLLVQAIYRAAR